MIIDENEFLETATVVCKMQRKIDGGSADIMTPEKFVKFMISMANENTYRCNYFSTSGFIITGYDSPGGDRVARSSVQPYLVKCYFEALEKEFKL